MSDFKYFNNAATSFPKAPGLEKKVAEHILKVPRHPGRIGLKEKENILNKCRRSVASLIKAKSYKEIVLTKNATEALNIAFYGLNLKQNYVVTTALEHNSVLRPLYLLENKDVIKLCIIGCDEQGRVKKDEWVNAIDRYKPRLVVLNHSSNVTGAVNDVKTLFNYAKDKGCITLLDCSQTIGLLDIDVSKIDVDILIWTGHKYLLGPSGTGGMYVRQGVEIEPVFVGGTGVKSVLKTMPDTMPDKLEAGTPAIPLFAGLLYSILWQQDNIVPLNKMRLFIDRLSKGLINVGADVVRVNGERTGVVSFKLKKWDVEEVGYVLDKSFGIICRTGLHCAPLIHSYIGTAPKGTIRFSISRWTTKEDIDYAIEVIKRLKQSR